ncbi:MAG: hypothetical protein KC545_02975, partial [Nitrospira sp.]|nr:hypothetical protein [Nitrospira sp.]
PWFLDTFFNPCLQFRLLASVAWRLPHILLCQGLFEEYRANIRLVVWDGLPINVCSRISPGRCP